MMFSSISIGQILAVLVTLQLIALSFVAYRIMRRKCCLWWGRGG